MDRISLLPDDLILQILQRLAMNEVICTSLLARRWRNLWKSVPFLLINGFNLADGSKAAKFITQCLMNYEGTKVKVLAAKLELKDVNDEAEVATWLEFAVRCKVEHLYLNFSEKGWNPSGESYDWKQPENPFIFPCHLYDFEALQILTLESCYVDLPPLSESSFYYLKKIELTLVEIGFVDTSGCPLLQELIIVECNSEDRLSIYAPNWRLRYLEIFDVPNVVYDEDSMLVIDAPHLLSIKIGGCLRRDYEFENLSSIIKVTLNFEPMFDLSSDEVLHGGEEPTLVHLLKSISHAKNIKLCQWCIQIVTYSHVQNMLQDWRKDFLPLQLKARTLEIKTNLNRWELPGVASILKNSRIESLCLSICYWDLPSSPEDAWYQDDDNFCFDQNKSWDLLDSALSGQSQLKTVKIINRMGREYAVSSMDWSEYLEVSKRMMDLLLRVVVSCNLLKDLRVCSTVPDECPVKSQLCECLAMLESFCRNHISSKLSGG